MNYTHSQLPIRQIEPATPKIKFTYAPHSDITAQEVANLIPKLMGKREMQEHQWEGMGPERRHLVRNG